MNNINKLTRFFIIFLLSMLWYPVSSLATVTGGKVTGLQMPAWVEIDGQKMALRLGMEIPSKSSINTSDNARILIELEEGSLVKLGENAQVDVKKLQPPKVKSGIFKASLNVFKGAFRFTTQLIGAKRQRNIDVKIGTVTAGIRGTDIWGKSDSKQDLVCLLEGRIDVNKDGYPAIKMTEPLSFYIAPKGKSPLPVAPVPEEKLTAWVPQTELIDGQGVLINTGQWSLNIASYQSLSGAKALLKKLDNAGYSADIKSVKVKDRLWHRINISHFKSRKDALYISDKMDKIFNLKGAWLEKNRPSQTKL